MVIVLTVSGKQFERELGVDQSLEMTGTTIVIYK